MNKDCSYSLTNCSNYKKELELDVSTIVKQISNLFIEYLNFIIENNKLKNTKFSKFIITCGLNTIINVFNHILLYTKNMNITYHHCRRSFYYYVEFVDQIFEDEKQFLKLSSRDATIYVYKKTIFNIHNDIRNNNNIVTEKTSEKLDCINVYVSLYKLYIFKLINNSDFTKKQLFIVLEEIYQILNKSSNKSANKSANNDINILYNVVENLYYKINDTEQFFIINVLLLKEHNVHTHPSVLKKCLSKFILTDFNIKLNEETPNKFVDWLIS